MDVRCERCRAQYVFDDDQVTPAGLTVQCTNCGHVFKVRKKELVVTVPVKPGELQGTPLPASAAAPRAPAPATTPAPPPSPSGRILTPVPATTPAPAAPEPREWRVRQANGNVFAFRELTTLQKWIIEQKVGRDDEISQGGENWKRLGNIPDLASFFQVVEAAERAKVQASAPSLTPVPLAQVFPVAFPPPGMYTPVPSGYAPPPYPPQAAPQQPPAPSGRPEPWSGGRDGRERDRSRAPDGSGRAALLFVVLVLVAGGAAVYELRPEWLGLGGTASDVAVPNPTGVPTGNPAGAGAASAAPGGEARAGEAAHGSTDAPPGEPGGAVAASAGAPAGTPPAPAGGTATPAQGASDQAPVPTPEPVGEATLPTSPEPVAKPAAPPPAPPKGPKAMLAEADRLRIRGSVERALDLYGRVVFLQPDNADALAGRGLCYLDLSQYPPAEASFQAALRIDPEQPDALLGLAETYRSQGRPADAIKYFEKYLAFHPDGDEAAVARNAIQQLRD
jgi:predicted Zn finger-like uncharacterized protein